MNSDTPSRAELALGHALQLLDALVLAETYGLFDAHVFDSEGLCRFKRETRALAAQLSESEYAGLCQYSLEDTQELPQL